MPVCAPFTPDQVASLNEFQASGAFHPFTCGNDDCPAEAGTGSAVLIAREDGWHCPGCSYTQGWTHESMADGTWKDWRGITVRVDGGDPVIPQIGETGWTDTQIAEFQQAWDEAKHQPPRLMPPKPLLTPELARALLRECVTVVEPGQTLVVRVPESWTPHQVDEYQRYWLHPLAADCGIKAMAVCGEELGVAQ